jgi:signal peptidase I
MIRSHVCPLGLLNLIVLKLPLWFALSLLFTHGCIVQSFYVPSSSMAPTLAVDDCIVVPKFAYGLHLPFIEAPLVTWRSPERGEVVVFHREDDPVTEIDESSRALVKRVVGIAGDIVTIIGTDLYVNGARLGAPYLVGLAREMLNPKSFTVPQGALFVLGDNLDESDDSRFWSDPFVRVERVVGPAAAVYWSGKKTV